VFTEHGDPQKILSSLGLDAQGIEASINKRFALHLKPTDATVNPSLKLVG
jgi:1-deoxy-D-xylulose-5-phosphate synthase